jgi:nucleoside-diphosphate-sugar epimerase
MLYNMVKPVIAITGANGFIGSSLLQYFRGHNYSVIALVRNASLIPGAEVRSFNLEHTPRPNLLQGVDVLIHCAFIKIDSHADAGKLNYEGTKSLIECAYSNKVKKIIFFSSVSAHEHALSSYGKSKLAAESLFNLQTDAILKCSLVIGNNGLFQRMLHHVLSKRFIPLINGGQQPLQIIAIDDVLKAVDFIINNNITGNFILANRQQFTYRSFFKTLARINNRRILFIPIPVLLLQAVIYISNLFNLHLPVNKDNLEGLKAMNYLNPDNSLAQLHLVPLSLEEKTEQLKAEGV